MNHFTVTHLVDQIMGTYDDGKHRLVLKRVPTDDFLFDCACIIDTISVKLAQIMKKENK
jgi:hypothetical protein